MQFMFSQALKFVLLFSFLLTVSGCATVGFGTADEKRAKIDAMKEETLQRLFEERPAVRSFVENAPGYAVFSSASVNALLFAAGTGYGAATNKITGERTYMNMAEGGVGIGVGAKDYRIIMVFHSEKALEDFITRGWAVGGNADAAMKAGSKGASLEGEGYAGNVTVYTITKTGLALQATIKGTRFWVDSKLN